MRSFRFRLERLREVRRYREREVEIRLAAAAGALAQIDRQLDQIALSRGTTTVADVAGTAARNATPMQPVQLDGAALDSAGWCLRGLQQRERSLRTEREGRASELADVTTEYSEVAKERKVLDKLRERRELEYGREQRGREQVAADEVVQSRSAHNRTARPRRGQVD